MLSPRATILSPGFRFTWPCAEQSNISAKMARATKFFSSREDLSFEASNQSQTRTRHQEDSISNSSRFFAPSRLCGKKSIHRQDAKTRRIAKRLERGGAPSMNHTGTFSRREALRMAATGL